MKEKKTLSWMVCGIFSAVLLTLFGACPGNQPGTVGVDSVSLPATAEVAVGKTITLTATVSPPNATDQSLVWNSEDQAIATVTGGGTVTGVKAGTAVIKATSNSNGQVGKTTVTVKAAANAGPVAVTGITLGETYTSAAPLRLANNASWSVAYTVAPANAANKQVSAASSASSIATAEITGDSKVKITATNTGDAVITLTTEDGNKTAAINVKVTAPVLVTSITLDKSTLTLGKGGTETLTATLNPTDTTDRVSGWESSDTTVATVSGSADGKTATITALKKGTATITVKAGTGTVTKTCNVTVYVPLESVSLSPDPLVARNDSTAEVSVVLNPADADIASVTWNVTDIDAGITTWTPSQNGKTLTVDVPVSAAKGKTARIVATVTPSTMQGGNAISTAPLTLTVTDEEIRIQKLTLSAKKDGVDFPLNSGNLSLKKGDVLDLTVTIEPANATNKTLEWNYNSSVSTLGKNGLTATLTVIGKDPYSNSSNVSVRAMDGSSKQTSFYFNVTMPVSGISLYPKTLTLYPGQSSEPLTVGVLPGDADNKNVTWSSSDDTVAKVLNGVVTAQSIQGTKTATITARSADGGFTDTCTVTVYGPSNSGGLKVVFEGFRDENIDLTVNGGGVLSQSANDRLTIIPPAGFNRYTWLGDGNNWNGSTTEPNPQQFSANNFNIGLHEITLICVKNDIAYSKTVTVRVTY